MIQLTQNGWLGVDIGTHTVKFAQVSRRKGQLCLRRASCIRFRPSTATSSGDALPDNIWRAIDFGVQWQGRRHRGNVACVLPKHCYATQFARLGDGNASHLAGHVEQYLRSAYGDTLNQHSWDYWHWPVDESEEHAEDTGVVVVNRQLAESAGKALHQRQLFCQTIDGLPTSLARATRYCSRDFGKRVHAAVDLGASQALFVVISEGLPVFVRNLRNCGLGDWLKGFQESLCLTSPEADAILQGHNLSPHVAPLADAIATMTEESLTPMLAKIGGEIHRTMDYLKSHRRNCVPTELSLFGVGSSIRNVATHLASAASLPVRVWHPAAILDERETATIPLSLLGPAIALSTLAWEQQ
jgi:Tfp pilus assembly PilM family ATPase